MVLGSLLAFPGLCAEAGPPSGQLGKTCPGPSQGVAGSCQPMLWQRCARRALSLWSPCAALGLSGGRVWAGQGSPRGRVEKAHRWVSRPCPH